MRSWRDDTRFLCPFCGKVVVFQELTEQQRKASDNPLLAVCRGCTRSYTAEQWKFWHGDRPAWATGLQ